MNFGNFGFTELLMVLVIVLVLFGAKRVPEIGASIGKGIREFKRNISDVNKQVTEDRPQDRLPAGEQQYSARQEEARPEPKRLIQ